MTIGAEGVKRKFWPNWIIFSWVSHHPLPTWKGGWKADDEETSIRFQLGRGGGGSVEMVSPKKLSRYRLVDTGPAGSIRERHAGEYSLKFWLNQICEANLNLPYLA